MMRISLKAISVFHAEFEFSVISMECCLQKVRKVVPLCILIGFLMPGRDLPAQTSNNNDWCFGVEGFVNNGQLANLYGGGISIRRNWLEGSFYLGRLNFARGFVSTATFFPFGIRNRLNPYCSIGYNFRRHSTFQGGVTGANFNIFRLGMGGSLIFLKYLRADLGLSLGMMRIVGDDGMNSDWFSLRDGNALLGVDIPLNHVAQQDRDWQLEEKQNRMAFYFQYGLPSKVFFSSLQHDSISVGMLRPSLDFRLGSILHPYVLLEVGLRQSAARGYFFQANHLGVGLRAVPFRKKGWAFMYEAGMNFRLRSGYPLITTEFQFGSNFIRRIWPGVEASVGINSYMGAHSYRNYETYLGLRFTPGEWLRSGFRK